jgi:hypothetical protein
MATTPITSLSNFLARFEKLKEVPGRIDLFRGHSDVSYKLQPSLFRVQRNRKDEKNIYRELITLHPGEFDADSNVFEKLVRMQHYSLPTRLLDLTFNPLVALFFACATNPKKNGELIRFSLRKSNIKYFDSDTASCIANLSNLTGAERDRLRNIRTSDDLNNSEVGQRLLQFIKSEKPHFLPQIVLKDLKGILAVKPKQSNRRILAQHGAFLLFGLTSELADDNDFDIKITKTPIAAADKTKILHQLDKINVNASTLFPEIESAAKYIMKKLSPVENGTDEI